MDENNNSKIIDNLSVSLGIRFNDKGLRTTDDCPMSEKAILHTVGELASDEVPDFTKHLHHCRFCLNLILDLRLAEEEARESAGQSVEVLPALADAVLKSPRRKPMPALTEKVGTVFSKLGSFLSLAKILVPLATACLVIIVVQLGLEDADIVRKHEVIRNRIGVPEQNISTPAKPPSMSPDKEVSKKSMASEKHETPKPQETIYSMAPMFKEEPESPPIAKKRKKRISRSPLEKLALSQLKLVGIVLTPAGNKAIVEDHYGKGHVITVGSYIGINAGKVIRIAKDSVIIAEEFEDESGTMTIKNIELKLYNKK